MAEYIGFEVELATTGFGTVSGIVAFYDDTRIDLTNIKINGENFSQSKLSFNSDEIKGIRILSISNKMQNPSQVSNEIQKTPSSRDLRRERLKKMPGAITAYVCDKSPPRVIKTTQPQIANHMVLSSDDLNKSYKRGDVINDDGFRPNRSKNKSSSNQGFFSDSASGFESDSATTGRQKHSGRRSKLRGRLNSSRQNDCFSLRVEDFPDADFDFEANLAKFDKKAFYEMTDAKSAAKSGHRPNMSPDCEKVLVEGPNGIGYVPASVARSPRSSTPVKSNLNSPASNQPIGSHWFTPSGKRVPFVAPSTLDRALQLLATGRDSTGVVASLPLGLSWNRILESAGQTIVINSLTALRKRHFDHHHQFPLTSTENQSQSLRVLVLPGKENFSGALALNLARHLANRDSACVLLCTPPPSVSSASSHRSTPSSLSQSFSPYWEEFVLAQTLAPQSSNLFHPSQSFATQDSSDDEESFDDDIGDSFAGNGDPKYSTRRLWMKRIPGLILDTKPSTSIIHQPTSAHIDLLVLGQPLEEYPAGVRQWLENVRGISLAIQLGILTPPFRVNSLLPSQALMTWVIQLGLPVASPLQVPESLEVHLVDVGLNKWILSRVADKRSIPPPALFETSSCIRLMSGSCGGGIE